MRKVAFGAVPAGAAILSLLAVSACSSEDGTTVPDSGVGDAIATGDASTDTPGVLDGGNPDTAPPEDAPSDVTTENDANAPTDAADGSTPVDAGDDASGDGDAQTTAGTLTVTLDPSLDVAGDSVKATSITAGVLLDATQNTIATGTVSGSSVTFNLGGLSAGDYFIQINSDADDLVPTKIDDPAHNLDQRVGQNLRDSLIGPSGSPTYRIRTWSKGQTSVGITSFDGTPESGRAYVLLTYATGQFDFKMLGTGGALSSFAPTNTTTHPTGEALDAWVIKSNSGDHHSRCGSLPGCHTNHDTKPATYSAVKTGSGWCYKCHLGAAGSSTGFVDALGGTVPDGGPSDASTWDTAVTAGTLTLAIDPSLDPPGGAVKVSVLTAAVLLDTSGNTVATGTASGATASIALSGIAPGDYFIKVNSDDDDLVPTRIDDASAGLYQRVGQKLRDSRIGRSSSNVDSPVYRIRTWSKGQSQPPFVYFSDGTPEIGKQPYAILTYATATTEFRVLGTAEQLVNLPRLASPHPTGDAFDGWVLKGNDGSKHHSSCSGCGCHAGCNTKPASYTSNNSTGWCYTCHYGAGGSATGFVDPINNPTYTCEPTCSGGVCVTALAANQKSATGLAVDGANVYWSNVSEGAIWKVAKDCGVPTALVGDANHPMSIAVDAKYLYYANWDTASLHGAVLRVPLDGSAKSTVLAKAQQYPTNLVVDATSIYWSQSATNIVQAPVGGGPPLTLIAGQHVTAGLLLDASSVYWTGVGVTSTDGFIAKIPIGVSSTAPTPLASSQFMPVAVAKDATNIYWTSGDGNVRYVPLAGGGAQTLASGQGQLGAIATDGTNVYWTVFGTPAGAVIMKLPVGGGTPVPIVQQQKHPETLVLDATSLYWTDSKAGTVMKLTPK